LTVPVSDPTWDMLRSGMYLIMHGLKNKYISPAFETVPYRDKAPLFEPPSEDSDGPPDEIVFRED
jgi:hypothetical protein